MYEFTMNGRDVIALVLVYLLIILSLFLSFFAQKKKWRADARKIVHIGVGNFVFIWWAFSSPWIMEIFFAIPFAVILFFAMFKNNPIGRSKIGELTREKGNRTGLFFYAVSIGLIAYFCFGAHWAAASIAMVAMTYGDGFGSIIGKKYGKHKIIHGKSLEGSFAVFLATFIMGMVVCAAFFGFHCIGWYPDGLSYFDLSIVGKCAVAGLITAVVEAVAPGDIDNLVNPLIIAGSMCLLGL